MIKDTIKEKNINFGDLVFILHKTKPMKTGWYRKVRLTHMINSNTVYVFEKSIHPNFNVYDTTLIMSKKERGVFFMKDTTLSYKDNNPNKGENEYEILVQATGITAINILQHGYTIPNTINYNCLTDINITDRGVDFLSLVNVIQPFDREATDIEQFARAINIGESKYE